MIAVYVTGHEVRTASGDEVLPEGCIIFRVTPSPELAERTVTRLVAAGYRRAEAA